ncbi:MAG: hypothetical protein Q7T94_05855 [Rugosibacter sp.]|nr:hypothetical protein [Rugosibacter sp.]
MTEKHDTQTLLAIIKEGLRQGYSRNFIADKLNLPPAEIVWLEDAALREDNPLPPLKPGDRVRLLADAGGGGSGIGCVLEVVGQLHDTVVMQRPAIEDTNATIEVLAFRYEVDIAANPQPEGLIHKSTLH